MITYQLATHYLPKIALRLECLFLTIEQACQETHSVIHHSALKNIFEIMRVIDRPELKSRFLKELMRIEHNLNKTPTKVSSALLTNLYVQVQFLSHAAGKFGETIYQDLFLQSVINSQLNQSFDGELYSPQLLLWLETNAEKRQHHLATWLNHLRPLYETVMTYLALLRDTAQFFSIHLHNGFYQRSLPPSSTCHLILLKMNKESGLVPKMLLGHHGLSLKLCESQSMQEVFPETTEVHLGICQL